MAIQNGFGHLITESTLLYNISLTYQSNNFSRILHQEDPEVHRSRLDQPLGNAPGRAPTSQTQAEETQLFSCLNYKGVFTHTASQIYPPSAFLQVQFVKHIHNCPSLACSESSRHLPQPDVLVNTYYNVTTYEQKGQVTVYYTRRCTSIVNLVHSSIASFKQNTVTPLLLSGK